MSIEVIIFLVILILTPLFGRRLLEDAHIWFLNKKKEKEGFKHRFETDYQRAQKGKKDYQGDSGVTKLGGPNPRKLQMEEEQKVKVDLEEYKRPVKPKRTGEQEEEPN